MEDDAPRFPLLTDAFSYALAIHGRQTMKGSGTSYMAHVMGVASIALHYGANEDEATAALLHDAVEDADNPGVSAELIQNRFGGRVASIVADCTDAWEHPKPEWHTRKRNHLVRMRNDASLSALLVYAADKLQNIRAILKDHRSVGEDLWIRFNGGKEGTLWYYRSCIEVFRDRGVNGELVDELTRTFAEVEQLAEVAGREACPETGA